ncbi:MAG: hypothetical protein WDZ30_03795, partial [Cellvibrionaceae bacterium]
MHRTMDEGLATFVAEEQLPRGYIDTARRWFVPLADEVARAIGNRELKILGIVGAQGSGKSTLAGLLAMLLNRVHGLRTVAVSLDDFYLTRAQRQRLAEEIHPLLITRGVPGTHDLPLAMGTLDTLLAQPGEATIPGFDKSRDERKSKPEWSRVAAPVD